MRIFLVLIPAIQFFLCATFDLSGLFSAKLSRVDSTKNVKKDNTPKEAKAKAPAAYLPLKISATRYTPKHKDTLLLKPFLDTDEGLDVTELVDEFFVQRNAFFYTNQYQTFLAEMAKEDLPLQDKKRNQWKRVFEGKLVEIVKNDLDNAKIDIESYTVLIYSLPRKEHGNLKSTPGYESWIEFYETLNNSFNPKDSDLALRRCGLILAIPLLTMKIDSWRKDYDDFVRAIHPNTIEFIGLIKGTVKQLAESTEKLDEKASASEGSFQFADIELLDSFYKYDEEGVTILDSVFEYWRMKRSKDAANELIKNLENLKKYETASYSSVKPIIEILKSEKELLIKDSDLLKERCSYAEIAVPKYENLDVSVFVDGCYNLAQKLQTKFIYAPVVISKSSEEFVDLIAKKDFKPGKAKKVEAKVIDEKVLLKLCHSTDFISQLVTPNNMTAECFKIVSKNILKNLPRNEEVARELVDWINLFENKKEVLEAFDVELLDAILKYPNVKIYNRFGGGMLSRLDWETAHETTIKLTMEHLKLVAPNVIQKLQNQSVKLLSADNASTFENCAGLTDLQMDIGILRALSTKCVQLIAPTALESAGRETIRALGIANLLPAQIQSLPANSLDLNEKDLIGLKGNEEICGAIKDRLSEMNQSTQARFENICEFEAFNDNLPEDDQKDSFAATVSISLISFVLPFCIIFQ